MSEIFQDGPTVCALKICSGVQVGILSGTIGICFLGTPHHGVDLDTWGAILTDIVIIAKPANRNVVKLLKRGSEILVDVQDAFHNVLEKRKEEKAKIEITCFCELLPVVSSCVVPKESVGLLFEILNIFIHEFIHEFRKLRSLELFLN